VVCRGAIITGSFLVPTFIKYGLPAGWEAQTRPWSLISENFWAAFEYLSRPVLGRFLSFASFSCHGSSAQHRSPPGLLEGQPVADSVRRLPHSGGILQWREQCSFCGQKAHPHSDWRAVKYFTLGTVVLLYISFYFP